jgi:glycerophosphoryl diester phosphodiesterase
MLGNGKNFTLIAHRGFSSDAPENTFAAFDLALEHGFNNIEADVQLTSDGVPVIIHDDLLDRTTTGIGAVAAASFDTVKLLDAGAWFGAPANGVGRLGTGAYAGEKIPTLEELLERYAGRINLHLELKSREQELAERVAPLLEKYGWVKPKSARSAGVSISSFDAAQLWRSKRIMPHLDHGFLLRRITKADCDLAVAMGCAGIYPMAGSVTARDITLAQEHGLFVRTWGVRTETDIRTAYESGASGTTVDWPLDAKQILVS